MTCENLQIVKVTRIHFRVLDDDFNRALKICQEMRSEFPNNLFWRAKVLSLQLTLSVMRGYLQDISQGEPIQRV